MTGDDALGKVIELCGRKDAVLSVCLASQIAKGQDFTLAALNISKSLASAFRAIVNDHVLGLASLQSAGDLELKPFTAGFKPDAHELEFMDAEELPVITERLARVPNSFVSMPLFDHGDAFVKGLRFYVMSLEAPDQPRVLFFRKYNAQQELSRSRLFAALLAGNQFDRISQPTLLFDKQIDCFTRGTILFISRKHDFQNIFGYFDHIEQRAHECLEEINAKLPLANFDAFAESCGSHQQKLMKLANIAASPYLAMVKMKDIRKVIKKFKLTGVRIIKKDGVEKLEFDPKNRWVILKLLNDDYLGSVMTSVNYEVNSKRQIQGA